MSLPTLGYLPGEFAVKIILRRRDDPKAAIGLRWAERSGRLVVGGPKRWTPEIVHCIHAVGLSLEDAVEKVEGHRYRLTWDGQLEEVAEAIRNRFRREGWVVEDVRNMRRLMS